MNRIQPNVSQEEMIQQQIIHRGITNPRVIDAIRATPREQFFPQDRQEEIYSDRPTSIGHGQTISQPYIVALMTDRLKVDATHRVLEIGTGSGYQTAILAKLAKEVYTVERIKPLLDEAWERLMHLNHRNVKFRNGDGYKGWPEAAPFDRVLIAAAPIEIPRKLLLESLSDGGIAILPYGPSERQLLVEVQRKADDLAVKEICAVSFVPMVDQA